MDIRQFLSLLHVDSGPDRNGNYTCRCPAHDDKRGSLSVREGVTSTDGKRCIMLKCFAGCTSEEIVERLGIKKGDLYIDPMPEKGKPQRKPPVITPGVKVPDEENPNLRHPQQDEPPKKKKLGKLEKVYHYTDEQGNIIFDVLRYRNEDGSKDFRQGVPTPGAYGGYRYSTRDLRHPLYRLPEVLEAKAAGKPIYVVEGEKDADNMAAMGYTATTNPGGAGKTIKWQPEHTEALKGATVMVLPDIDDVGLSDRRQVAGLLIDAGCKVKFLDLRRCGVQLPDKGDISDLMQMAGAERTKQLLTELEQKTDWATRDSLMTESDWRERCVAEINQIGGYRVQDYSICGFSAKGDPQPLSTFVAMPRAQVFRDDGLEQTRVYQIDGWDRFGNALPTLTVPDSEFRSMNWVSRGWGFAANIMPGTSVADKLRYVIAEVGSKTAATCTQYAHTGWRKIKGQWCYLYQGGSIGGEHVDVDLGSGLKAYDMTSRTKANGKVCALLSYISCMDTMSNKLRYPLMAITYLAPLRDALERAGQEPGFLLYLNGKSGTGKSTAASIAMSHFGSFEDMQFPATFSDTGNSIAKKAFIVKDTLFVVDDYHPTKSLIERRKMETTMQSLCRAFGNHAARGRMNADSSLRESAPPRCVTVITGEYVPDVGDSGVARCYVVELQDGVDVKLGSEMTMVQDNARDGIYRKAMTGYIEWLAGQMDELPEQLLKRYRQWRDKASADGAKGQHARVPGMIASLMLGYEKMLEYMVDVGVVSQEDAEEDLANAYTTMIANADGQTKEARSERPTREFLDIINELLVSKAAAVAGIGDRNGAPDHMIGWVDGMSYYLLPGVAYQAVVENYRKRGQEFPLTQRGLYKQLADEGVALRDEKSGKNTRVKWINSKAERVLEIPRKYLDGAEEAEQVGFELAEDEALPFDK